VPPPTQPQHSLPFVCTRKAKDALIMSVDLFFFFFLFAVDTRL
jgi:hypothetical protein